MQTAVTAASAALLLSVKEKSLPSNLLFEVNRAASAARIPSHPHAGCGPWRRNTAHGRFLQYCQQPPFLYQHSNLSARKTPALHGPSCSQAPDSSQRYHCTKESRKTSAGISQGNNGIQSESILNRTMQLYSLFFFIFLEEDRKEIWMYTRNSHEIKRLIIKPSQILTEER